MIKLRNENASYLRWMEIKEESKCDSQIQLR